MGTADHDHLLTRLPRDVRRDWAGLAWAGPERADGPAPAFDPAMTDHLPDPVRRWLLIAIAPGAPLSTRVRMHQHGRINLRGWRSFQAQQVISQGGLDSGGYIWACSTRFFGLPVRGYDRLVSGRGDMVYRLLDRLTVVDESGPDLVRSAVGRLLSELCWVPAAALAADIGWTGVDDRTAEAGLRYGDETFRARFTIDETGHLQTVRMLRWASVDGKPYTWHEFGADVHETAVFDGYTIPRRITAGYGFGSERWPDCAFIEMTVDRAEYG